MVWDLPAILQIFELKKIQEAFLFIERSSLLNIFLIILSAFDTILNYFHR
jgi:hypothetical protein